MRRSIQGMLEELEPNLWEHVLCRLVDYGHCVSPEIEMAALHHGAELLHGEAVNIDMALTTQARCDFCVMHKACLLTMPGGSSVCHFCEQHVKAACHSQWNLRDESESICNVDSHHGILCVDNRLPSHAASSALRSAHAFLR
jgi:hypothetical protein